jgi:hypothetical protein
MFGSENTRGQRVRARSMMVGLALAASMVASMAIPAAVWAQSITVADPWIRGTVPSQKATGMFARITSPTGGKLVAASSPIAGVVEIHEMVMDGNVMRMHAIPGLDLPAGKVVELKPGGFHVMLMDLKEQAKPGQTVPVTLVVEDAGGKRESIEVKATVRELGAAARSQGDAKHDHHKH